MRLQTFVSEPVDPSSLGFLGTFRHFSLRNPLLESPRKLIIFPSLLKPRWALALGFVMLLVDFKTGLLLTG